MEEARNKHLEGLKDLKNQYKKFEKEVKRIIKSMKQRDKKMEASEIE